MQEETIRGRNESKGGLPANVVDTLSIPRSHRFGRFVSRPLLGDSESRPFVVFFLAVLLALSLTSITNLTEPAQPAAAAELSDEALFVALINELRVDEGLPTLTINAELTRESRVWADQLRTNGELSHAGDLSVGVTTTWLKLGENVGVGPIDRIEDLFDAFVASPDHYANLIDPTFEVVGVGVVYDDEGRMWTTHRFMDIDNAAEGDSGSGENPDVAASSDDAPAELASTDSSASGDSATGDSTATTTDSDETAAAGEPTTESKEIPRSAPPALAVAGTSVDLNEASAAQLFELLADS